MLPKVCIECSLDPRAARTGWAPWVTPDSSAPRQPGAGSRPAGVEAEQAQPARSACFAQEQHRDPRSHSRFPRFVATMPGKQLPKVEQMPREAHNALVAFTGFPVSHGKEIWSTNPLDRLNTDVRRRTDAVGVSQP